MAKDKGGTQLYCERCQQSSPCRRIRDHEWNRMREDGKSEIFGSCYSGRHPEIHYHRRPRQCLRCGHRFVTVELAEEYLLELNRYRSYFEEIGTLVDRLRHLLRSAETSGGRKR